MGFNDEELACSGLVATRAEQADADRAPAVAVKHVDGACAVRGEPSVAPLFEGDHGGQEFATLVGEAVLHPLPLTPFTVGLTDEQTLLDEVPESARGDGLGKARAAHELVKPAGAVKRLPHQQHRRARADDP